MSKEIISPVVKKIVEQTSVETYCHFLQTSITTINNSMTVLNNMTNASMTIFISKCDNNQKSMTTIYVLVTSIVWQKLFL